MSVPTTIDFTAPVIARHAVDVAAPLDMVWALHTDVNAWPTWQTDITAARLDGEFTEGAAFTWTSFGFSVTSTIYDLAGRARVLWGGTADGITGIHEWLFTASPTGVHVATNESFAGPPIATDATNMQRLLDGSLQSWLAHLKAAAESRSASRVHSRARESLPPHLRA